MAARRVAARGDFMSLTVVFAVAAIIVTMIILWAISVYNRLVRLSNLKEEAWGGMDVQLKRRFDLAPNLVETVRGYASHERATLQRVTEARSAISDATARPARIDAENALTGTLRGLFAIAEAYPGLKANENFGKLQSELSSLENELQLARRYYNGAVREFNIAIQSFPSVLISRRLGYNEARVFEADEESRDPVKVDLG
jgi:LemA protein